MSWGIFVRCEVITGYSDSQKNANEIHSQLFDNLLQYPKDVILYKATCCAYVWALQAIKTHNFLL